MAVSQYLMNDSDRRTIQGRNTKFRDSAHENNQQPYQIFIWPNSPLISSPSAALQQPFTDAVFS